MQNIFRLFFLFFFSLIAGCIQPVYSQTHKQNLFLADSLFNTGNYLEAQEIYKEILNKGQEYSPQMLLKMAFTEEALKRYPQSMYYLNQYYRINPNRAVLTKMEEVAKANGLRGYTYQDSDFFITQFKKYYLKLLEIMLVLAVVSVTLLALKPGRPIFKSHLFRVSFLVYLSFLFFFINFLSFNRKGIVNRPQAALMAGPAAGAHWLATLPAGNRLTITGENDIWYEVKWDKNPGYIRKNNLLLLPE